MRIGSLFTVSLAVGTIGVLRTDTPAYAADNAQIRALSDVSFGALLAVADQGKSQNVTVCSYRGQPNDLPYSVRASGSGPGGTFTLVSGPNSLPYDVQWADTPNQTSGTMLQAGVAASGFGNAATGFTCSQQPATASLTVTLRAIDLSSAQAGTYSGSLQLTIVPE